MITKKLILLVAILGTGITAIPSAEPAKGDKVKTFEVPAPLIFAAKLLAGIQLSAVGLVYGCISIEDIAYGIRVLIRYNFLSHALVRGHAYGTGSIACSYLGYQILSPLCKEGIEGSIDHMKKNDAYREALKQIEKEEWDKNKKTELYKIAD